MTLLLGLNHFSQIIKRWVFRDDSVTSHTYNLQFDNVWLVFRWIFLLSLFSVQSEFIRSLVLNINEKEKLENSSRIEEEETIWLGLVFVLCFLLNWFSFGEVDCQLFKNTSLINSEIDKKHNINHLQSHLTMVQSIEHFNVIPPISYIDTSTYLYILFVHTHHT